MQEQDMQEQGIEHEGEKGPGQEQRPASVYMENYRALAEAARELREQDSVDIDRLIPLVDKALGAYGACKERIEAVERLLAERLGEQTDPDPA